MQPTEAGETTLSSSGLPSAPLAKEQEYVPRYPVPNTKSFDSLERKVLAELVELKKIIQTHQQQQQRKPATSPLFMQAINTKNWKEAARLMEVSEVTVLTKAALIAIFSGEDVLFQSRQINPDRLALWKVVLRKTKITSDNLANIRGNNATALQLMLIHGDAEILHWIRTKSSDDAIRKGVKSNVGGYSLIAWMADFGNVAALQVLFDLKYPQSGLRVFPVVKDSDWNWPKFSNEVKRDRTMKNRQECYAFWGANIAIHL